MALTYVTTGARVAYPNRGRDMTEKTTDRSDESKRAFVKKGAVAATAAAVGAGATAGTAAAQDEDDVVVFGSDYRPDVNFDVVDQVSVPTKLDIIDESGAADTVFDDPDDWDVFIINYDLGSDAPTWGILFTEDVDLSAGDSETMGEVADLRDPELGMIEVEL